MPNAKPEEFSTPRGILMVGNNNKSETLPSRNHYRMFSKQMANYGLLDYNKLNTNNIKTNESGTNKINATKAKNQIKINDTVKKEETKLKTEQKLNKTKEVCFEDDRFKTDLIDQPYQSELSTIGNEVKNEYYQKQLSNVSTSSNDDYKTPDTSICDGYDLQKSFSMSAVPSKVDFDTRHSMGKTKDNQTIGSETNHGQTSNKKTNDNQTNDTQANQNQTNQANHRGKCFNKTVNCQNRAEGVLRSKSDFQIPKLNIAPPPKSDAGFFQTIAQKSDSLFSFLTPLTRRRMQSASKSDDLCFVAPAPPVKCRSDAARTSSLNSLRSVPQPKPLLPPEASIVHDRTCSMQR